MSAPYAEYLNTLDKQEVINTLAEIRNPFEIAFFGTKNGFNFCSGIRTGHSFLCSKYYAIEIDRMYQKAAMTAFKWEKHLIDRCSIDEFLRKIEGRNLIAFERRCNLNTQDIRSFQYPDNPIFLFGAEDFGVPDRLLERANAIVSIPISGFALDLNMAVACGMVCLDWYSKYTKGK